MESYTPIVNISQTHNPSYGLHSDVCLCVPATRKKLIRSRSTFIVQLKSYTELGEQIETITNLFLHESVHFIKVRVKACYSFAQIYTGI